jgi:hypothetical protein
MRFKTVQFKPAVSGKTHTLKSANPDTNVAVGNTGIPPTQLPASDPSISGGDDPTGQPLSINYNGGFSG